MKKNKIIHIINEEINYAVLDIDEINREQNLIDVVSSFDFQKTFLYDLFFNHGHNISIETSDTEIITNEFDGTEGKFSFDYTTTIEYKYNNNKIQFDILFNGKGVKFKLSPSSKDGSEKVFIDWGAIDYDIFVNTNDLVIFNIFDKTPPKVERMFIRSFIGPFIEETLIEN